MKGCVGLKEPEPFEADEQPLTVRECDVVLLLGCVNETSPAVFPPWSCIPRPVNASLSIDERDRSSFPWSSFEPEVLRRYGFSRGVDVIGCADTGSIIGSS